MVMVALTEKGFKAIFNEGVDATWAHVDKLQKEHADFYRRLNLDSKNSGKPPSTDPPKTRRRENAGANSRRKSGKKPGGQFGHKGSTREQVKIPDEIHCSAPVTCSCGHQFDGSEEVLKTERRQVTDIPEPQTITREYQALTCECSNCGNLKKGTFPAGVKAPFQYGNNLRAYVNYLMSYQLLPYKRTTELLENLFGLKLSQGTLKNINLSAASILEEAVEEIKAQLTTSDLVHFDESGLYVEGKRDWLHVASNDSLTYYFHHKSRGIEAMDAAGVIAEFEGIACHDYWSPYYHYDCAHLLCNAHHLRDLEGVIQNDGHAWAKSMQEFLRKANSLVKQLKSDGKEQLSPEKLKLLLDEYSQVIKLAYLEMPPAPERKPGQRGRVAKGKSRNLLERFDLRRDEIIDFVKNFSSPFDNNQAERDLRMIKVKQKISGSFRSEDMAQGFLTIRSYISTAIKQGLSAFDTLADGLLGKHFIS